MKLDGTLLEPLRQFVTDKEYAKYYISAVAGEQYTMQTLQMLHTVEQVNRLQLSQFPCVVKPSHLSGQVQFLLEDDRTLNRTLMRDWLKQNYYHKTREQHHKYLTPKILVEEFFSDGGSSIPNDYKIYCFKGSPRFVQVDLGRFTHHTRDFYDTDWQCLPWTLMYPASEAAIPRPDNLEEMLDVAAKLSAPFSFIRVDMYTTGKETRVGEMTNCPESASGRIRPLSGEYALGRMLLGKD